MFKNVSMHIINIFDGYSDDDFTIFVLLNKDFELTILISYIYHTC